MPADITQNAMREMVTFIKNSMNIIDWKKVETVIKVLIDALHKERNVLVVGMGRSGLVGRAFALRLMHMGFKVYVFGETIMPAIGKDDVVIAISGSGETDTVVRTVETARKIGAIVISVTSRQYSSVAKLSNYIIVVPGKTKHPSEQDYFVRQLLGVHEPLAPLGTLFEVTSLILLDSMVSEMMRRLNLTEEQLKRRHATIE